MGYLKEVAELSKYNDESSIFVNLIAQKLRMLGPYNHLPAQQQTNNVLIRLQLAELRNALHVSTTISSQIASASSSSSSYSWNSYSTSPLCSPNFILSPSPSAASLASPLLLSPCAENPHLILSPSPSAASLASPLPPSPCSENQHLIRSPSPSAASLVSPSSLVSVQPPPQSLPSEQYHHPPNSTVNSEYAEPENSSQYVMCFRKAWLRVK